MLQSMNEVAVAIRAAFWFIPTFISIYLVIDNAGGHGTKQAMLEYETMLKLKYNIKALHQVPNSPDTNLLDLGVC